LSFLGTDFWRLLTSFLETEIWRQMILVNFESVSVVREAQNTPLERPMTARLRVQPPVPQRCLSN
jgi:hypothetical protein